MKDPADIPADLVAYVRRNFSVEDAGRALSMLGTATLHDGTLPGPRLLRCTAVASRGSMLRLEYYIEQLTIDWRDVILAGEYGWRDGDFELLRDLSEPLLPEE